MLGKVSLRFASAALRAFVLLNLISFSLPTAPLVCVTVGQTRKRSILVERCRILIRIKPRKPCVLPALMYFYLLIFFSPSHVIHINSIEDSFQKKIFCHFDR